MNNQSQHILVSTDLSDESLLALPIARIEQELRGAKVTLLHVVEASALAVMPVEFSSPWIDIEPVVAQIEERARQRLAAVAAEYFPTGDVSTAVVRADGATYEEILHFADAHAVTLLVMTKHGRSGIERLFLGSVTNKVIQLAKCAVLVVPVSGKAGDKTS